MPSAFWRDPAALPQLLDILKTQPPANQRAAAEAIGRLGDSQAIPTLLEIAGQPHDRALEHSLTYALIEIANVEATTKGLASANPHTRRAALFALDQMRSATQGGSHLNPSDVVPLLSSDDPTLKTAADWLVDRHPDWAAALVDYFRSQLSHLAENTSEEDLTELENRLARFASQPVATALLAESLANDALSSTAKSVLLRVMARSTHKTLPPSWIGPLLTTLENNHSPITSREAIEVLRRHPLAGETSAEIVAQAGTLIKQFAVDETLQAEHRLAALSTIPGGLQNAAEDLLLFFLEHLDNEQPVGIRSLAVEALAKTKLDTDQLIRVCEAIASVSSLDIEPLLEVIVSKSADEKVGLALVAAIETSPARRSFTNRNHPTPLKRLSRHSSSAC